VINSYAKIRLRILSAREVRRLGGRDGTADGLVPHNGARLAATTMPSRTPLEGARIVMPYRPKGALCFWHEGQGPVWAFDGGLM
jgi:hypothetical protein